MTADERILTIDVEPYETVNSVENVKALLEVEVRDCFWI
ncbi:hypothetical protein SLEP1_g36436 [Rubroshorea leprosula]|uniref:Uncharacterized protein n=1 Tax=Rubroshorea leprosula TaxID=152421 RepID=A0AAV5KRM7_9ROSI|nr:hypothetical protein SLEP1_g36436 [Rubroshorea leprosula]